MRHVHFFTIDDDLMITSKESWLAEIQRSLKAHGVPDYKNVILLHKINYAGSFTFEVDND